MGKRTVRDDGGQQIGVTIEPLGQLREELKLRMRATVLEAVGVMLAEERRELIGEPWSRKREGQARSGGSEQGSIYLEGRRMPVRYTRMADAGGSHMPATYRALRSYDLMSQEVQQHLVRGISTRDYGGVVSQIVEGTGLRRSSVSRAFVRASQKSLDMINQRDLSKWQLAVVMLDAIGFGESMVVVAMGITLEGQKVLLGLQEGHTENATVVGDLLDSLVERKLVLTDRFLAVIDGAKALRSALLKRWDGRVMIQRCQLHKKRNVIDYLPKQYHAEVRRRLTAAYGMKDAGEAQRMLLAMVSWLGNISESAAGSLKEGLEETLTVIQLGLPEILRKTLSTTNPIESIFDTVRSRSIRVKRWRTGKGHMVMRWVAATGLEAERRLNKIRGHRQIGQLLDALKGHGQEVKKVG